MLKKHDIVKHKHYPRCTFVVNRIWEGFAMCSRIHKKKFGDHMEWVSFGNSEKAFAVDNNWLTKIDEWK